MGSGRRGWDAAVAVVAGMGAPALELSGWIAYYRRDHAAVERFAEAGRDEATDAAVRASCDALLGRAWHTRGQLAAADALLSTAEREAPAPVRGVARVWLASLRIHQGRAREAIVLAERALVDPGHLGHPFAAPHALFAAAYSHALQGHVGPSFLALDRLDALIAEAGEQILRFTGIAANTRGWLLRNIGQGARADEHTAVAAALPAGGLHDEPRVVALLDLADGRLATGDLDGALARLSDASWVEYWEGSMAWHQRQRYELLRARLALACGEPERAAERADAVAADAASRGSARYQRLAELVAARAAVATHDTVDLDAVEAALADLGRLAGLEAWWVTAETASAFGEPRWWRLADAHAETLIATSGEYGEGLRTAVTRRFDALGHS